MATTPKTKKAESETVTVGLNSMVSVSSKKRKRIGRGTGSGSGKTSGRGHKGQKSRSGGGVRPGFEGGHTPMHKLMPKKRGFNSRFAKDAVLNVSDLQKHFKAGDLVTRKSLVAARLMHGNIGSIKILGEGEITNKLTVIVDKVSKQAKEKIEKAGGQVKLVAKNKGVTKDVQKVS